MSTGRKPGSFSPGKPKSSARWIGGADFSRRRLPEVTRTPGTTSAPRLLVEILRSLPASPAGRRSGPAQINAELLNNRLDLRDDAAVVGRAETCARFLQCLC